MPLTIRFMRRQDIPQVTIIDRDAFPTEWPPTNFPRELENGLAYYIIAYQDKKTNLPSAPMPRAKKNHREYWTAYASFLPANRRLRKISRKISISWVLPECG